MSNTEQRAFTPGPLHVTADGGDWSASHDGLGTSCYQAIRDQLGTVLALVVAHHPEPFSGDLLNTERNAALFAAAPDLYEALRIAVRQNSHDMLMTGEELRICEAALTRATTS